MICLRWTVFWSVFLSSLEMVCLRLMEPWRVLPLFVGLLKDFSEKGIRCHHALIQTWDEMPKYLNLRKVCPWLDDFWSGWPHYALELICLSMRVLKSMPLIIRVMEMIWHRCVKSWNNFPLISRIFRWYAHYYKDLPLIGRILRWLSLSQQCLKVVCPWSDHCWYFLSAKYWFVRNILFLKSNSNSILMQVFWNRKLLWKTDTVHTDDIWPWGRRKWRCENVVSDDLANIWSQFNVNFSKYAFIVNLVSIRTFKGYNMVWFTVYETKGL